MTYYNEICSIFSLFSFFIFLVIFCRCRLHRLCHCCCRFQVFFHFIPFIAHRKQIGKWTAIITECTNEWVAWQKWIGMDWKRREIQKQFVKWTVYAFKLHLGNTPMVVRMRKNEWKWQYIHMDYDIVQGIFAMKCWVLCWFWLII